MAKCRAASHRPDTTHLDKRLPHPCAGRFGFQREMNALKTLRSDEDSEDSTNVNSLLHGTHEIELRLQQINRWFRLWRKDVRDGWGALGRFKVSLELAHMRDAASTVALRNM